MPVGRSPAADTQIVPVPDGVRMSNVYLRGPAAGEEGRAVVRAAADRVGHIPNVFDELDLRRPRASEKLGDMALEAEPPYHFSLLDDGRERGSHGSTFKRSVPLVIAGAGVRPRRRGLRRASLVDVARTKSLRSGRSCRSAGSRLRRVGAAGERGIEHRASLATTVCSGTSARVRT
jgi:hypothetical protein